jgi:hypothetical protein
LPVEARARGAADTEQPVNPRASITTGQRLPQTARDTGDDRSVHAFLPR